MNRLSLVLTALLLVQCNQPGRAQQVDITDSGGPLSPEQAAYDVTFYDLALQVDPEARTIQGALTVSAKVVHPMAWLVLDLDTVLSVAGVEAVDEAGTRPLSFERRGGRLWSDLGRTHQPGEAVRVRVRYGGTPRGAENPPWSGGFTWATTADGHPWIATSVQGEGADLWWPCKDHPSDEPDSMALHITVPAGLTVASNGRLRGLRDNGDGTSTFHWFVSTPINNYGVALNIAPYRTLQGSFRSVAGEEVPITFWVLPERYEDGRRLFPQFARQLAFYEKYLGPYPFRADKYGVAHTPFLGMEHQTIIAYGSNFSDEPYGYDWLHHHELGHEWWGNLVTAPDWRDFWIHEGFCTFMQALYSQELFGNAAYLRELNRYRAAVLNRKPVAPRESRTTDEMYFVAGSRRIPDNDIYYKGALVLHTLRGLIGDEAFFTALRRMAYPSPALERVTDGRQCRFATTADFQRIAEEASGQDLGWFFEVYLRQARLPVLVEERTAEGLALRWEVPGGGPFPLPVEVAVDGAVRRVEMRGGRAVVQAPAGAQVTVDPNGWLLLRETP